MVISSGSKERPITKIYEVIERLLKGNRNDRKTIMMYDPLMEGTK